MHVTIGIKMCDEAKKEILRTMIKMQDMGTRGLYTDPDDLILPMVEINDIDNLERLKVAIDQIKAYEFTITLDRIDHKGALYWIEIEKNDYFTSFERYLYERLRYAAIDVKKRNKNHIPHIVISRKTVIPRKSKMPDVDDKSMNVNYIYIMEVDESGDIPHYTELFRKKILTKD